MKRLRPRNVKASPARRDKREKSQRRALSPGKPRYREEKPTHADPSCVLAGPRRGNFLSAAQPS